MNREEKSTYINSLKESLNANSAMMIYHYQGLNVTQLDDLRKKMRAAGALLKVTKNEYKKKFKQNHLRIRCYCGCGLIGI